MREIIFPFFSAISRVSGTNPDPDPIFSTISRVYWRDPDPDLIFSATPPIYHRRDVPRQRPGFSEPEPAYFAGIKARARLGQTLQEDFSTTDVFI
ncbi:hypothetical protein ACFX16_026931 [Malus domestica]